MSVVIFRLVQVPALLSFLEVEEYGRWLVLSSIPSWITLANLGFGSVASNRISMLVAAGDTEAARSLFSTTIALVGLLATSGTGVAFLLCWLIPFDALLDVADRRLELAGAAFMLSLSVLLSFYGEVFSGRFRAARKAHYGILVNSLRPWCELLLVLIVLLYGGRFDWMAAAVLASTILYLFSLGLLSRRSMPSLFFQPSTIEPREFGGLFRKGLAFQAMPAGHAVLLQGFVLVVQWLLGPAAVAVFTTARTLVRSINQMVEMVNQVIWPEMSHLLGGGDLARAARLHRLGVGASLVASIGGMLLLATTADFVYHFWTRGAIEMPDGLILLFLLPVPFRALWYTSGVVHFACNEHEGLALRYLAGTCLALLACAALTSVYGLAGAAVASIVAELFMIRYTVTRSLELTNDSYREFVFGIVQEARSAPQSALRFVRSVGPAL